MLDVAASRATALHPRELVRVPESCHERALLARYAHFPPAEAAAFVTADTFEDALGRTLPLDTGHLGLHHFIDSTSDAMSPACDHEHPTRPPAPLREPAVVARGAAILRAMGDPERLPRLERLAVGGEHCVSELATLSDAEMSTVSQRLRQLRAARLVERRREGKHVYYAIADAHVADLVRAALDHAAEERGEAR